MRHVQALSSIPRFLGIRPQRGHVPCTLLVISELIHVTRSCYYYGTVIKTTRCPPSRGQPRDNSGNCPCTPTCLHLNYYIVAASSGLLFTFFPFCNYLPLLVACASLACDPMLITTLVRDHGTPDSALVHLEVTLEVEGYLHFIELHISLADCFS